jgi:hypothetical protein
LGTRVGASPYNPIILIILIILIMDCDYKGGSVKIEKEYVLFVKCSLEEFILVI